MADLTREEQFLSGIAEGSTVELKPITRREQYLAKIAGQDVEVPDPITREEMLLKQIADGGGGGGGGSGAVVRTYTGTLDTVFEENAIDFAELCNAVEGYNTSAIIEFDYENTEADQHYHFKLEENVAKSRYFYGYGLKVGASSNFGVCYINMTTQGKFNSATDGDGNPIDFIDGEMPCTLTIIDHPLSSSITAEALSVTANSEYDAPLGKLYNHVSVEVPQQGATIAVLGPFDVGDVLNASAITALRMVSTNHNKTTSLVKANDYYYRVFADLDTTALNGTIVCWYIDITNNLLIKKNIVYSGQKVTVNELGSPFEVIRIASIQA